MAYEFETKADINIENNTDVQQKPSPDIDQNWSDTIQNDDTVNEPADQEAGHGSNVSDRLFENDPAQNDLDNNIPQANENVDKNENDDIRDTAVFEGKQNISADTDLNDVNDNPEKAAIDDVRNDLSQDNTDNEVGNIENPTSDFDQREMGSDIGQNRSDNDQNDEAVNESAGHVESLESITSDQIPDQNAVVDNRISDNDFLNEEDAVSDQSFEINDDLTENNEAKGITAEDAFIGAASPVETKNTEEDTIQDDTGIEKHNAEAEPEEDRDSIEIQDPDNDLDQNGTDTNIDAETIHGDSDSADTLRPETDNQTENISADEVRQNNSEHNSDISSDEPGNIDFNLNNFDENVVTDRSTDRNDIENNSFDSGDEAGFDMMASVRNPYSESSDMLSQEYGNTGETILDAINDGTLTYEDAVNLFADTITSNPDEIAGNMEYAGKLSAFEEAVAEVYSREENGGNTSFREDVAAKVEDIAPGTGSDLMSILDAMDAVTDSLSSGVAPETSYGADNFYPDPVDVAYVFDSVLNDLIEPGGIIDQGIDMALEMKEAIDNGTLNDVETAATSAIDNGIDMTDIDTQADVTSDPLTSPEMETMQSQQADMPMENNIDFGTEATAMDLGDTASTLDDINRSVDDRMETTNIDNTANNMDLENQTAVQVASDTDNSWQNQDMDNSWMDQDFNDDWSQLQ